MEIAEACRRKADVGVRPYDGVTGEFIDSFVTPGSGGLNDPTALVFGPDGDLFVGSGAHSDYYNSILRYNGTTGAFKGVFVTAGSAGLTLAPTAGVIFGPDVNNDNMSSSFSLNSANRNPTDLVTDAANANAHCVVASFCYCLLPTRPQC